MSKPEDQQEAQPSSPEPTSAPQPGAGEPAEEGGASSASSDAEETSVSYDSSGEHFGYDDGYGSEYGGAETKAEDPPAAAATAAGDAGTPSTPSAPAPAEEEDDDDEGMLRMSFLEHLEELRSRILKAVGGLGVAFILCLVFANDLWRFVSAPAIVALKKIGADPNLAQITPMDAFTTIWVKVPLLAAIFVASPWVLYQVWAFIAPGLYRKERRWATPFILTSAGLFIAGGLFAYFVAFRFGLEFLLSIGRDINVKPVVSIVEYFDLFVNVMLGIGLVFELPVLVFFLTLLRITTPGFLIRNSRYAILVITLLAAVITPTPDIFNLMLFTVPMCLLYFVGVFASYLLVLHRDDQPFPWKAFLLTMGIIFAIIGGGFYLAMARYGYKLVLGWPPLAR